MKNITSFFVLLFMTVAMVTPIFPHTEADDCCCGDSCMCESMVPIACEMEITSCETPTIFPIPVAPLNKVNVDHPAFDHQQVNSSEEFTDLQDFEYFPSLTCTSDPPPAFTQPLLI